MTLSDGATRTVRASYDGLPLSIKDELGRTTTMVHGIFNLANRPTRLLEVRADEGNRWAYGYATNGLIRQISLLPKSGNAAQVWRTEYGPCGQPTAKIDARGHRTDIEYSPTHCGILKRTLPADSKGIRAQTRYTWGQKYAWIKTAIGNFQPATSPVWVLLSEEFCKTSAADSHGNCAAGASDKVVTTYEYQSGSPGRGSNVFVVGTAVTANGQTLRTCYGLDDFGRQISETQPKAGLMSCQ